MERSLTLVVPALNEEPHLATTIREAVEAMDGVIPDYEILIYDDGSTDLTGEIADLLAEANQRVEAIHHGEPRGLGYCWKSGVRLATKSHVLLVPGDNELRADSLRAICQAIGGADIVLTYALNPEIRPRVRRIISRSFAWIIRKASGLDVKYFNGPVVHRTAVVRRALTEISNGFAYQAETLIRLIQGGATYTEVGMYLNARPKTSAFRISNVYDVVKSTSVLAWRLRWQETTLIAAESPTHPAPADPLPTLRA